MILVMEEMVEQRIGKIYNFSMTHEKQVQNYMVRPPKLGSLLMWPKSMFLHILKVYLVKSLEIPDVSIVLT